MPSLLFVCLGNICRSPMAEGAMRAVMAEKGLGWRVDSAGTGAWHAGNPPDRRAQTESLRRGVDISRLQARQVCEEDFTLFTHILALDDSNLADLRQIRPSNATAQLSLLMDWVPGCEGQAVADPYYGNDDGFARAWEQVSRAASALAESL